MEITVTEYVKNGESIMFTNTGVLVIGARQLTRIQTYEIYRAMRSYYLSKLPYLDLDDETGEQDA